MKYAHRTSSPPSPNLPVAGHDGRDAAAGNLAVAIAAHEAHAREVVTSVVIDDAARGADRLAKRVKELLVIGERINRVTTLEAVLDTVTEWACEALGASSAAVFLLDEGEGALCIRAARGVPDEIVRALRVPIGEGIAGRIAATRAPVLIADTAAPSAILPVASGTWRSFVGVPLLFDDRVTGVLLAGSSTPSRFTDDEVTLLELTGSRAASAIVRARLYDAERDARTRAELLQRISAALTPALSRTAVADVIVGQIAEGMGASSGGVLELSADGLDYCLIGSIGIPSDVADQYRRFPVDTPVPVRDVARDRAPVFLRSRDEWIARFQRAPRPVGDGGSSAWAALPLVVDDRFLGAITLSFALPREFSADERSLMGTFAGQCAQALDRARAYENESAARDRAERAAHRLAALQVASVALGKAMTPQAVGDAVMNVALPELGAARGSLALVSADGESLELVSASGYPADTIRQFQRVPLGERFPLADVARSGTMLFLGSAAERAEHYPDLMSLRRDNGAGAMAAVPLRHGERVIGTIGMNWAEARELGAEDRVFLESIAGQCAQALERARLFEAERAAHAEAEEARKRSEEANEAKMNFLTAMSHELRTPLNAIAGYVDLMSLGLRGPVTEQQRMDLERIRASQLHLTGLINDVLNFAKLDAGKVEYALAPVSLRRAVDSVDALLTPLVLAKAMRLVRDDVSDVDDVTVYADEEKVRQILLNLMSNAIKYTGEGGQVLVRASRDDTRGVLRVEDTGMGIDATKLEGIFEPFVQLGRTLTSRTEGTGLGLAISRELARAMGGDLVAESRLGAGSTFTLTLPLA